MPETLSDTGPVLHLHEISRLETLSPLSKLLFSDLVSEELQRHGVTATHLRKAGINFVIHKVEPLVWRAVLRDVSPKLQPADAQVFCLARDRGFQTLVLTDDLALRQILESRGNPVAGTVGVLIRAYKTGWLSKSGLDSAIDALFEDSTLHLSRAFRAYLHQLISELP